MLTIMAGLAEFERDLIRERVKSGLARAHAAIAKDGHFETEGGKRRANLGRRPGYRPPDKHVARVLEMHAEKVAYRVIGRKLGLSKNTVKPARMAIAGSRYTSANGVSKGMSQKCG